MIHRDAQTAFLRCVFPKRRNLCRTRNRDDLPCDLSSGKRILAAKTARKTDDFPKHLRSPRGTRAGDDSVPTHIMLRAALKLLAEDARSDISDVPTHIMPRAALKLASLHTEIETDGVPTHIMLRAALILDWCSAKKALHLPLVGERNAFHIQLIRHRVLTQMRTNDRIEIQKGHCRIDGCPSFLAENPAYSWKRKAGFLIYRRTLIINTVNTTRNVKNS